MREWLGGVLQTVKVNAPYSYTVGARSLLEFPGDQVITVNQTNRQTNPPLTAKETPTEE